MTPSIDRNEAPETWITAAPLDTLTIKDQYGRPIERPVPTEIPVRFHLYWAGSDRDGAVAGFYYAVVETTVVPVDGLLPPLPGPKPGQYSFTTKTDTTFVFTVSEMFADRQHAFFVYAVDNQGKADPTPARFFFSARDKYPPQPVIDVARATGEIISLTSTGEPISEMRSFDVTDTLIPGRSGVARDTVPAYSRLDFKWHGEITQAGAFVMGYRFWLGGDEPFRADSSTHSVSYGTGLPDSKPDHGVQVFTLQALDQAGGAATTTRRFVMNFAPDTWWAGPDPDDFTGPSDGEYGSHSVNVTSWPGEKNPTFSTDPPLPAGSTFGPDSFRYLPSRRLPPKQHPGWDEWDDSEHRTFYEIYKDRLYARTEGDTVHQNSFVILWNGGYDKDSPYIPRVARDTSGVPVGSSGRPLDPVLRGLTGAVIEDAGRVGSPIGFRSQVSLRLTPAGLKNLPAQTTIYPVYDPASVFRSLRLGSYWRMTRAGKAFAVARSEDADEGLDNSAGDQMRLAETVDNGGGTPADRAVRRKVLVFYVGKAPALVRDPSLFRPREGESITTREWNFLLRGMDLDPFDPESPKGGGPSTSTILRYTITLVGKDLSGRDTSWTYLGSSGLPYIESAGANTPVRFTPGGTWAKNPFASGPIRVSIQICDCLECETVAGQGRCVGGLEYDPATRTWRVPDLPGFTDQNVITVNYTRPASGLGLETTSSSTGGRPGPDPSGGRD